MCKSRIAYHGIDLTCYSWTHRRWIHRNEREYTPPLQDRSSDKRQTTWRWCFWSTSIADAGIQCLGYFYLRETYAPKILSIKAERLRKETGNPDLRTEWEIPGRTFTTLIATNLVRPFRLLGTQIIIQVIAIYM